MHEATAWAREGSFSSAARDTSHASRATVSAPVRSLRPLLAIVVVAACVAAPDAPRQLTIERELILRDGQSTALAWSHDGKWIASGGACGDVLVVDAATGRTQHEWLASKGPIDQVAFAPNASTLAIVAADGVLSFLEVASGAVRRAPVAPIRAFAWSHGGDLFAIVDDTGGLAVHRTNDLARVRTTTIPNGSATCCVAFSPDDLRIAVRDRDGSTRVVSRVTGVLIHTLPLEDEVLQTTAGPEGGRPTLVWKRITMGPSPAPPAPPRTLLHRGKPRAAAITSNGRHIALVAGGDAPFVFDIDSGARIVLPESVRGVPVAYGGGTELALWQRAQQPESWRTPLFRLRQWALDAEEAHRSRVVADLDLPDLTQHPAAPWPSLSVNGRFAGTDRDVFEWRDGKAIAWDLGYVAGRDLVPAPDGTRAAAIGRHGDRWPRNAWDVQLLRRSGEVLTSQVREEAVLHAAWSLDSKRLALLTKSGLHLLDPTTLASSRMLPGTWSQFSWVDAERVLLVGSDRGVSGSTLLQVDRGEVLAQMVLPDVAELLCTQTDGTRAVFALHDRAIVVRIAP